MELRKRGAVFVVLSLSLLFIFILLIRVDATTYSCNSCGSCTAYLTNITSVAGDTIQLTTPLSGATSTCIDFGGKKNVTFDCQGNTISGTDISSTYGVYFNNSNGGSNNDLAENCNIDNFYSGVYIFSSSNDSLTNIVTNNNTNAGIWLNSASGGNLTNIISNYNTGGNPYGIAFSSGSNIFLTNFSASNNYGGIYMSSGSYYDVLTNLTLNNNTGYGYISSGGNSNISNMIANYNQNYGLVIAGSHNIFTNITTINNTDYGITINNGFDSNTFVNVTAQENKYLDFGFGTYLTSPISCNYNFTNVTSSGGRPIEFYNSSVTIQNRILGGLFLCNANNSIINNVTIQGSNTLLNNYILVSGTYNSTFSNINSSTNYYGLWSVYSGNNTLTNITANNNAASGVYLSNSVNNTLTNITANNNNQYGLSFGLQGESSITSNNIIANSTFQENNAYEVSVPLAASCNNLFTNVIGSGGRSIGFYNSSVNLQNQIFSELILCGANNSILNNVVIQGSDSLFNDLLLVSGTYNSTFSNINSSTNYYGMIFAYSGNDTLTNLITNNNPQNGLELYYMNNMNLTNITSNNNNIGIYWFSSPNSTFINSNVQNNNNIGIYFYNTNNTLAYNNYLNNTVNYRSSPAGLVTYFNTSLSGATNILGLGGYGGNVWVNPSGTGFSQTCIDSNLDGICDLSYNLDNNSYDYLPLFLPVSITTSNSSNGTTSSNSGGGNGGISFTGTTTNNGTTSTLAFSTLAGVPITMNVNSSNISLTQLTITTNQSVSNAIVTISQIPSIILQVAANAKTYQSFQILTSGVNDSNIANVSINFQVNNSWISANNLDPANISLYRSTGTIWTVLPTILVSQDSQYYYFSAISPGFSNYTIVGGAVLCDTGEIRCLGNQSQVCSSNKWILSQNCQFGCVSGECRISTGQSSSGFQNVLNGLENFINNLPGTLKLNIGDLTYYALIIIIVSGAVIVSFSIVRNISKKRTLKG